MTPRTKIMYKQSTLGSNFSCLLINIRLVSHLSLNKTSNFHYQPPRTTVKSRNGCESRHDINYRMNTIAFTDCFIIILIFGRCYWDIFHIYYTHLPSGHTSPHICHRRWSVTATPRFTIIISLSCKATQLLRWAFIYFATVTFGHHHHGTQCPQIDDTYFAH